MSPSAASAVQDAVDWNFIDANEGGVRIEGYVPSGAQAGVTVGAGVDLGSHSAAEMISLGLPDTDVSPLEPYFGLKASRAIKALAHTPLLLSTAAAVRLTRAVQRGVLSELVSLYSASNPRFPFAQLPSEVQTAVVDLAYQYGPALRATAPRSWASLVNADWAELYEELENFGDAYGPRRRREAKLLSVALRDKNLASQTGRSAV